MKKKRVSMANLKPGTVIANPVYTHNDQQIIPKDTIVTDALITRLVFYGVTHVMIRDTPLTHNVEATPYLSYYEQVKESEEFHEFKSDFLGVTEDFKITLNNLLQHNVTPDSIQSMLQGAAKLLDRGNTNLRVFDMLHNMRDMDDATYVHSVNVALIATVLGRWTHLAEEDLSVLTLCGLLHDIGKLMIPKDILLKPDILTSEERSIIKTHTTEGYQLLSSLELDERIALVALTHHERCDGSGYPSALTLKRIHDFSKIVAIADIYDAMSSARVYRGPICPFEIIALFEQEGYSMFDPRFLLPFMQNIVHTYMNTSVRLTNGETGIVIMMNKRALSSPVVKCGDTYVDLSRDKQLKIQSLI